MLYQMFNLALESNIPLPELPCIQEERSDCSFQLLPPQETLLASRDWFHGWTSPDGETWLGFAKFGRDYLLRFRGQADFAVSADGNEIRCFPHSDTSRETLRHLLLNQVLPLILSRRGNLAVHASAVLAPEGAVAFIGGAGEGKSTLAASFAGEGFPLFTDDCFVLKEERGEFIGIPSYPGLRLWPQSVSALFQHSAAPAPGGDHKGKTRLAANGCLPFCSEPSIVKRMYFMVPAEQMRGKATISIDPVSPRDAAIEVLRYMYILDITDREQLKESFERVGEAAGLRLFYRLAFPRDFSLLPTLRKAILAHLKER